MKRLIYLFLVLIPYLGYSQSVISELANGINSESRSFKKALLLERALNTSELFNDSVFSVFRQRLDHATLDNRMLLSLSAQGVRSAHMTGSYSRDLNESINEPNPYIKYFDANYIFFQGDALTAKKQFIKCLDEFSTLNDTFYLSSSLNNIGAIYWNLDLHDSALYYFLKSKEYTYWYNEMLESNILAIANELNDGELARRQIEVITKNNPSSKNGVYLNNLYHYFKELKPENFDSISFYIYALFDSVQQVPNELIPVYVKECWYPDELPARLLEMPANSYYRNSLYALIRNECILNQTFSDSVLVALNTKLEEQFINACLDGYVLVGSENRQRIFDILSHLSNNEEESTQLTRLRELIESYEQQIDESEKFIQKSGVVSISLAFLTLITIIFLQRRKILETQKANTLIRDNTELEKERLKISGELASVRKSINNIARENLDKLNALRDLIADQESKNSNSEQSYRDLNIIRTHQEGIIRFKINRFCDDLNAAPLEQYETYLSEQEFKIFKLMILEFRSKEIATLLDVSHQYINNKRHKIRTSLTEAGFDLDELVVSLRKELYA